MPIKDRTATHGYAERDITHHLSLSIRNGVYTNDAVKGSAHAAVHTYQSNMQGRCMAKGNKNQHAPLEEVTELRSGEEQLEFPENILMSVGPFTLETIQEDMWAFKDGD
ncbi:uncharacterized protein FRV6_09398 [Fusarium oxysporum]|uniref:Uncharacterized protein n=1 Tax=Fusarium oxysporum TaxID=5507 RepID=A0A2H3THQ4_FUSOX|nr:uncharacterized protein FRV6_09398 [Fusarium oxysporum]